MSHGSASQGFSTSPLISVGHGRSSGRARLGGPRRGGAGQGYFSPLPWLGLARRGKAGMAWFGSAPLFYSRQGEARLGKARPGAARRGMAPLFSAGFGTAWRA